MTSSRNHSWLEIVNRKWFVLDFIASFIEDDKRSWQKSRKQNSLERLWKSSKMPDEAKFEYFFENHPLNHLRKTSKYSPAHMFMLLPT